MLIGAHVSPDDPVSGAADRGAEVVQLFLSSPMMWRPPVPRDDDWCAAVEGLPLYVHAPYLVNLASARSEVRDKSATLLQATLEEAERIGARGVVVHAGHPGVDSTVDEGVARWIGAAGELSSTVPLLIENLAKGDPAMGRHRWQLAALLEGLDGGLDVPLGFCLDTNHLWEGTDWTEPDPEQAAAMVHRWREVAGAVDLLHVNSSRHPAGAGRDHHDNLASGSIPEGVLVAMITAAEAPAAIVETPGGCRAQADDIAWLAVRR